MKLSRFSLFSVYSRKAEDVSPFQPINCNGLEQDDILFFITLIKVID